MTQERKDLLEAAILGIRGTIARLEARIATYESELSGVSPRRATRMGRQLSAEGNAKISEATKRRREDYRAKKAAGAP